MKCVIDKGFRPIFSFNEEFSARAKVSGLPFEVALERNDGYTYTVKTAVLSEENPDNLLYAERLIKSLLWLVGGYKLYIRAPRPLFDELKEQYRIGGKRDFDVRMMERVYEHTFEVIYCKNGVPDEVCQKIKCSKNASGARIGFDAGGSDRKVAAVLDGEVLYSEEVVWFPKTNADPKYHYEGIKAAMEKAASYLPRVDSIGVSSAGIYVNNKIMLASLFLKVSDEDFDKSVKNMYIDVASGFNAPLVVANDGDVAALAGAIDLGEANILGIAMGTSEAAGYIDGDGNLLGWLNELAFVPADVSEAAEIDEWSGDYGTGVSYLSQDGVIKLARIAGLEIDKNFSPAEKLKYVQKLVEQGDKRAENIFRDVGVYLGYSLLYYETFYHNKHLLLMGRVTSGRGGELVLEAAKAVLKEHKSQVVLSLPDEKSRRVGQAVAASFL